MAAVDPAQRRGEIVSATFGLLAEGGVEAATMRRVAATAGATTGRVAHYFDSRVDVLVGALVEVDRRRLARSASHDALDAASRLRAVLCERLLLDSDRVDEQRVCLALSTTGMPELRDELARQGAESDRLVGDLALRLIHDSLPRTRRDAERTLDTMLMAD